MTHETIEDMEARAQELRDRITELELMRDDAQSELEDLEYDIERANEEAYPYGYDEIEADDRRQRTRDLLDALRGIGGGW